MLHINSKKKTKFVVCTWLFIMGYLFTAPGDILIHTRDETDGNITGATVKIYLASTPPPNSVPCDTLPSTPVASKTAPASENYVRLVKGQDFTTDPDPSPTIPNNSKLIIVVERDGFLLRCIDNYGGLDLIYDNTCDPDSTPAFNTCITEQKANLAFSVRIEVIKRVDGEKIGIYDADPTTNAKADLTNIKFDGVITGDGIFPDNNPTSPNVPRLCTTNNIATGGDDCTVTPKFLVPVPFETRSFKIFIAGYQRKEASLTSTASFGQTKVYVEFDNTCTPTPTIGCGPSLDFSTTLNKIETELGGLIGIQTEDPVTQHISNADTTNFIPAENDAFNGNPYLDTTNKVWLLPITSNFFTTPRSVNIIINGFAESGNTTFNNSLFPTPDTTITYQFDDVCSANICSAPLKYAGRIRVNNIENNNILPSDLDINLTSENTFVSLSALSDSPLTFNGKAQYGKCSEDENGTANCVYLPVNGYLGTNDAYFDALLTIDGFTQSIYNFQKTPTFTQQNFTTSPTPPFFSVKVDKIKDELGNGFKINGNCPSDVSPCNADITESTLNVSGNSTGDFSIVKTLIQTGKVLIAISGTKKLHETEGQVTGQITIKISGFVGSDSSVNGVRTPPFNLNLNSQIDIQFGINECTPSNTTVCAEAQKYKLKFTKLFAKALHDCSADPQDVSEQIKNIPSSSFSLSSSLSLNGSLQTNTPTDNFYYLPLNDNNNGATEKVLSIGKNTGITLNVCSREILYAGVDIDISNSYTTDNLATQFEIQIAPWGSCTGNNTICTNSSLVFNSLKIVTRDETAGKITGAKVSIYKNSTPVLCSSLPITPYKEIEDGNIGSDFDGTKDGEILSSSPGLSNTDKLTFVIEKDGYVKRCDDNGGLGYSFSSAIDASGCSDPNTHGTGNCFFEYLQFNVVVNLIKRSDDKRIGFLTADAESNAVVNSSNTKIFDIEADTGNGSFITVDGDVTENRARFCEDNNTIPVNNIGQDCSTTKKILIPLLPTTKKFRILISGYTEREVNLSSNSNIGIQQVQLVFSDNSADCSGVTCINALQTSVVIDKIEDELSNIIGIGTTGTLGSFSLETNTTFSNLDTQLNGNPYISSNNWFVPSTSNFSDNTFTVRIAGFTEITSGVLESATYSLANPQIIVRFVQNTQDTNKCPTNSQTIKCFNAPKFAALIRINNIESNLKPSDISYLIDTTNSFIKVVKNGVTLSATDFNINNKGTFSKCPEEATQTKNCLYLPVINFLGQNQTMNVELTIDGFTKGSYNFNATTTFTQQEPIPNSGPIRFSVKVEKIKDELDKYFKINAICNFDTNCNNSNITTSLIKITPTLTSGPAGNFSLLTTWVSNNGILFFALKGTKTISEQESSPPVIKGKIAVIISGFVGETPQNQSSQSIEISDVSLSNSNQIELKFGFSDTTECPTGSSTIFCSPKKFKYKLKLTKIVAQDNINPAILSDVTVQIGNLLNNISSSNGASLNGYIQSSNTLFIGIYDTSLDTDGTNINTQETIILGTPNVVFTLNNKSTTYETVTTVISQIFFDTNTSKQFTLEIAPSSGTVQCSPPSSITICANKFFAVAKLSITNLQIITPSNGEGLSSTQFKFKFTYTDIDGGFPSSVTFTLDTDSSLSISANDLIKEHSCTLTEENPTDTDTTDGKNYFCELTLFFISDGTNRGFNEGRFILKATSGSFSTTVISDLNQVVSVKDNPPQLTEPTVSPSSGAVNTTFEFRVKYKDIDNHPPSFIELLADLNGNNTIESNEIFQMTKVNINDDNFGILGVVYRVSLKISEAPKDNTIRYGYRAGDGFVDKNSNTILTTLPDNFKRDNITSGTFFEVSISSTAVPPEINWGGSFGISGFEESNFGLGFVEPDSGNSGNNFTFLVVYTSPNNSPASSIKVLYRDKYGRRSIPLQQLTNSSLSQIPAPIKTNIEAKTFLFDGNFQNGELYFAIFPLFNSDITIYSVEASDGIFVVSKTDFNSVIKISVTDNDNDGIDDAQEGATSKNSNTIVSLNALDDPPISSMLYTFRVSPNAVFSPPPPNPFFTSITAPGNLEEGVLGSGKLPSPLGVENSKLLALFQLGVRLLSGNSVTFTVTLPYILPTNAKVFKLGKNNIWTEVTNSISLSSDRKSFTLIVENNSEFDRDSDFFGSSDPGGFKFVVDPIGIFAPEVPTLPSESGGPTAGGGCYSLPKNPPTHNDHIFLLLFIIGISYLLIRRIYIYLYT